MIERTYGTHGGDGPPHTKYITNAPSGGYNNWTEHIIPPHESVHISFHGERYGDDNSVNSVHVRLDVQPGTFVFLEGKNGVTIDTTRKNIRRVATYDTALFGGPAHLHILNTSDEQLVTKIEVKFD